LRRGWRPPAVGVTGAPVVTRRLGDLVLVTSPVALVPKASPTTMALHDEVLASVLGAASAVLPLPFGTAVAEGALEGWLAARLARVRTALPRLRGCVEMDVRLLWLDLQAPPDRGARQLRALAERLVEQAEMRTWRYLAGEGRRSGASLAFLVRRDEVSTLLSRIAPVASRADGVAVVPTGPWPPYSFAPALGAEMPLAPAASATGQAG
jgi:hypothetical protein